ncbi:hypothetical protein AAF712_006276 [Marasmius tenuissimus]|uniref:Transmembrane protein n=1 Tax=Marasmius tenuissimus TaxID=585030 RepID=A0ABR2ZZ70_9AGAR
MPVRFSSVGYQVLSSLIYFFGLTILTACASRRLPGSFRSMADIREISLGRLLVFLIMVDSWLFLFSSGLLVFGIGMETYKGVCEAGPLLCVFFYGSSKVLIYCFLVEKVHLVWSPTADTSGRFKSKIWLSCMALNVGYVVIVVLMLVGLIHYYREDGYCVLGIETFSSIPLLVFDLVITIVLNTLFIYPLFSSRIANPRLRAVAIRTIAASVVALITSSVNIAILTVNHGAELGWVCFGSCGIDVILNALTIFYVTGKNDSSSTTELTGPADEPASKAISFNLGNARNNQSMFGKQSNVHAAGEAHALQVMVTTRTSLDRDGDSLDNKLSKNSS